MCGILFSTLFPLNQSRFSEALALMRYRGPDDDGCIQQHGLAWLGHNRLAILDLSEHGRQPFYSADGRYAIVFNGEIYNYLELAREHGLVLRTRCDTEVLLELYVRYGAKMLDWLNGMFAFVIYDTLTGALFAARDRLGIKPLYVHEQGQTISFSSEIAPLLHLSGAYKIDPIGLRQYLKLRTFFNGRTLYEDIKMFPAGCYYLNGLIHTYWQLPEGEQAPPSDEELRELITSAVSYRRISDVPVGSYLSGGLDSSIIAALAQEPHTWTVGFNDANEFSWARLAAHHLHSEHHEILLAYPDFPLLMREMVHIRLEPLSVPNEVLLLYMTRAVKKENTVVLCGEGADELFFGYDRIFRWAAEGHWDLARFSELYAYGQHADLEIVEDALSPFLARKRPLDIVAAFFQQAHLHGLLRRLDFATMLCSVEARVPFVDHRLVERLAGVPFTYRMAEGVVKAPLKRCFGDLLPPNLVSRPKMGFPVPLEQALPSVYSHPMQDWFELNLSYLQEVLPDDCGLHIRSL
ncbi:MAG: asparagine synthase (glutamine-hydrolyzing) [Candidatus Sericytochromatia bacterium]